MLHFLGTQLGGRDRSGQTQRGDGMSNLCEKSECQVSGAKRNRHDDTKWWARQALNSQFSNDCQPLKRGFETPKIVDLFLDVFVSA